MQFTIEGRSDMRFLSSATFVSLGIGVAVALQSCTRNKSNVGIVNTGRRDACEFIQGQQYPYDWEGSDVGACVVKLPPQAETVMEPDQIYGLLQIPRTIYKTNAVHLYSPFGDGIGEFDGELIRGTLSTPQGEVGFICSSAALARSSRGVCGIR